jgi:hypothetical protein
LKYEDQRDGGWFTVEPAKDVVVKIEEAKIEK